MSEATPQDPGKFIWRELITPDVEKSKAFYGELFGWKYNPSAMPGFDYQMVDAGRGPQAGIFPSQAMEKKDAPPCWLSYVSGDPDAVAAATRANGGQVLAGPMDIANVGRIATLMDDQGAVFAVYQDAQPAPAPHEPGPYEFCWEQLNVTDPARARAFYGAVLGWTVKPFANGTETLVREGGGEVATLMAAPPGTPPHWLSYVITPGRLGDALGRVKTLGGRVFVDSIVIPNMGTIGVIGDNVGAVLGLFEPALTIK